MCSLDVSEQSNIKVKITWLLKRKPKYDIDQTSIWMYTATMRSINTNFHCDILLTCVDLSLRALLPFACYKTRYDPRTSNESPNLKS